MLDLRARKVKGFRCVFDPIIRFQFALRFLEYLINTNNFLGAAFFKIYFRRISVRLGFTVPPNVFGPGLCIVHYGTLVVNPNARIGRNCRIHVGVNIGGKAGFYSQKEAAALCPRIGNNCYIGPGAKIFGPVEIGRHCSIGANAVVTRSFPGDGLTIIGIPARSNSS